MKTIHPGMKIRPSDLPASHEQMVEGRYEGETDDGVPFALIVRTSHRGMTGNELMKATVSAMRRGKSGPTTLRVEELEISLMIGKKQKLDIHDNGSGYYHYGQIGSRNFREVVEKLIAYFGPKPAAGPRP